MHGASAAALISVNAAARQAVSGAGR